MNNKENIFTSTGTKILHHPDVIRKLQNNMASPVSVEIAPTSRCQLSCVFCSNVNRDTHEDLDFSVLTDCIVKLKCIGLKTVEWTGGGDPTMYKHINEGFELANDLNLEQGMITNGLGFNKIKHLDFLKWLRISLNSLDYVDDINIPFISKTTTLGFSYVINSKTTLKTYNKLQKYAEKYRPEYIRIVPNCQTTIEQQEENNITYGNMVKEWGEPFFYQAKIFERPDKCYWGYLKPFILHDGYVYRCSSVVLNDDADRSFHSKYRWCKIQDLVHEYNKKMIPFNSDTCHKCVFTKQNNVIESIVNPQGMVNFI